MSWERMSEWSAGGPVGEVPRRRRRREVLALASGGDGSEGLMCSDIWDMRSFAVLEGMEPLLDVSGLGGLSSLSPAIVADVRWHKVMS